MKCCRILRGTGLIVVVLALTASAVAAAQGRKQPRQPGKPKTSPPPVSNLPPTKGFDKITCIITGGKPERDTDELQSETKTPEAKESTTRQTVTKEPAKKSAAAGEAVAERYEETMVTGESKYELRSRKKGAPKIGSMTKGQMEQLKKRINAVNWKKVKKEYPGSADGGLADLTVTISGKTYKTRLPIEVPLLPDFVSDVPEPLTALVEEVSGVYKRFMAGDRNVAKPKPRKAKGKGK